MIFQHDANKRSNNARIMMLSHLRLYHRTSTVVFTFITPFRVWPYTWRQFEEYDWNESTFFLTHNIAHNIQIPASFLNLIKILCLLARPNISVRDS